ncbi:MAG TPA: response regulator transcription factor [Acidimicrobiales bacterium]|nr:response regulator transcription factor [Acidimicrobiales bacterium]
MSQRPVGDTPAAPRIGTRTLAVVVVDALPLVQAGMASALLAGGIRVAARTDRLEAGYQRAEQTEADVLVVGNPGPSDIKVLGGLLERGTRCLRLVVLVGQNSPSDLADLAGLGVEGFLSRSASGDELADTVRRVAAGERVIAPSLLPLLLSAHGGPDPAPSASSPAGAAAGGLTPKETEVLLALCAGCSNRQIATRLFISHSTVKSHLSRIYERLGVRNRDGAVARAFELGLMA